MCDPGSENNDKNKDKNRNFNLANLLGISGNPPIYIVLIIFVFGIIGIPVLTVIWAFVVSEWQQYNAFEMQDRVQEIDDRVQQIDNYPHSWRSISSESISHFDIISGQRIAIDFWQGGQLVRRQFYQDGDLVAMDTFIYFEGDILSKTREFFEDNRVVLTDEFDRDGYLISKMHCPGGEEESCFRYMRDFISPLPPPVFPPPPLILYR